jgi:hypothetical protein
MITVHHLDNSRSQSVLWPLEELEVWSCPGLVDTLRLRQQTVGRMRRSPRVQDIARLHQP